MKSNTKAQILNTALELFSKKGYEATSVGDIAASVGIKAPSLYAHYKSKRDIFDSILQAMERNDAAQADEFRMPLSDGEESAVSFEQLIRFSLSQFRYWTEDPFASNFRKLLTVEQYRSPEMQALYAQYLAGGPLGYVEEIFRGMGIADAGQRALAFFSPMFLCYSLYDCGEDSASLCQRLRTHFETFYAEDYRKEIPQ